MNKKEKNLRIVLKKVGENPEIMNIENTLEAKQKLVNGWIEVVSVTDDILLICNEEGKLENLLPNLNFGCDYIAGDCFFVGDDYENGDFKSLTENQIEEVKSICKEREFIYLIEIDNPDEKEMR